MASTAPLTTLAVIQNLPCIIYKYSSFELSKNNVRKQSDGYVTKGPSQVITANYKISFAYLRNLDRQRAHENAFYTMLYAVSLLSTCLNHKKNG